MKNNDYVGRIEVAKVRFRLLRPDLDWSLVLLMAAKSQVTSRDRDTLKFVEHWGELIAALKPLPFENVSG